MIPTEISELVLKFNENKIIYRGGGSSYGKCYSFFYNIIVHFITQVCDRLFIEKEEGFKILLENIEEVQDEFLKLQKKTKNLTLKNECLIKMLCEIIELKAKKDAEIKAETERLEAENKAKLEAEKLEKEPIKKQLYVWVESFEIQNFKNDNEISNKIIDKFNSFKNWAKNEIDKA